MHKYQQKTTTNKSNPTEKQQKTKNNKHQLKSKENQQKSANTSKEKNSI